MKESSLKSFFGSIAGGTGIINVSTALRGAYRKEITAQKNSLNRETGTFFHVSE